HKGSDTHRESDTCGGAGADASLPLRARSLSHQLSDTLRESDTCGGAGPTYPYRYAPARYRIWCLTPSGSQTPVAATGPTHLYRYAPARYRIWCLTPSGSQTPRAAGGRRIPTATRPRPLALPGRGPRPTGVRPPRAR